MPQPCHARCKQCESDCLGEEAGTEESWWRSIQSPGRREGWRAGKCNSSFAGKEPQLPMALPSPATGPSRLGTPKGPCLSLFLSPVIPGLGLFLVLPVPCSWLGISCPGLHSSWAPRSCQPTQHPDNKVERGNKISTETSIAPLKSQTHDSPAGDNFFCAVLLARLAMGWCWGYSPATTRSTWQRWNQSSCVSACWVGVSKKLILGKITE